MGSVAITLLLDEKGFTPALQRAGAAGEKFKKTMQDAGHASVSQMQAASGAIRIVNGDIEHNVRAVERLLTTIPGVGKLLQAAFPVIGGLAFVGMIAKIGEEAYNTVKKVEGLRDAARESFLTMSEGSRKSADMLRLTNDRIEEQIAKLEHKPANTMAMALDEARVAADELAASLNKDYTEFKKVEEANRVGMLGRILGKGSTDDVASGTQDRLANLRTLGLQAQQQRFDGDTSGANATEVLIQMAQKEAIKWAKDQAKMRSGMVDIQGPIPTGMPSRMSFSQANGDQGQNLDALGAFSGLMTDQLSTAQEKKFASQNQAQLKNDEEAKQRAADAIKAQELLLKSFQEAIARQKAMYGVSVADELAFWSARTSAFSRGSEQYHAVEMEQFKLQAELLEKLMEGKKKYLEYSKGTVEGSDILAGGAEAFKKIDLAQMEAASRAAEEYNKIIAKGNTEQEKAANEFAEMSVGIALAQGSISRLDAAQALSAIHANDHANALKRVNDELQTQIGLINADPKLSADEKTAAIRNAGATADNQTSAINAGYAKQKAEDSVGISNSTISGAVRTSLDQMVQSFTDMAANLKDVIPRTLDGLNTNIANLATGQYHKGDVGRTLLGAGQGLIKTGLQSAEGSVLKAFGLGKRDGSTSAAALWVQIAQAGMGAPSSISTTNPAVSAGVDMATLIPGGSFIQPFIKAAAGFLPGFAEGGDFLAGHPMVVGENGPEIMMPRTAGSVIPNHMLGGDQNHFHFNIQGNSDPAAVHAAIMRAAPHIAAAAVQTTHASARRSPPRR